MPLSERPQGLPLPPPWLVIAISPRPREHRKMMASLDEQSPLTLTSALSLTSTASHLTPSPSTVPAASGQSLRVPRLSVYQGRPGPPATTRSEMCGTNWVKRCTGSLTLLESCGQPSTPSASLSKERKLVPSISGWVLNLGLSPYKPPKRRLSAAR